MKKVFLLLLVFIMVISLPSCTKTDKRQEFKAYYFDWFDTVTVITGYEESKDVFDKRVKEIEEIFSKYHKMYDIYTKYQGMNNLAVINEVKNGVHSEIPVEQEIIDLIKFSKSLYNTTGGKFNIALGSVLSIWHTYREEGMDNPSEAKIPPIETLESAAQHIDINSIILDEENKTVFISDSDTKIDVGAVAKGYACEMAARYLEDSGVSGYVINAGGNIRTIGSKPNGDKWTVGIENPDTSDKETPYIEYLALNGQALVTSGNYQRFYIVDGKNYHHIIDPDSLMPSDKYMSVSVLANDSGLADGLSTALFNMSIEDGKKLVETLSDVEALWVLPNGEKVYSKGFSKFIINK